MARNKRGKRKSLVTNIPATHANETVSVRLFASLQLVHILSSAIVLYKKKRYNNKNPLSAFSTGEMQRDHLTRHSQARVSNQSARNFKITNSLSQENTMRHKIKSVTSFYLPKRNGLPKRTLWKQESPLTSEKRVTLAGGRSEAQSPAC